MMTSRRSRASSPTALATPSESIRNPIAVRRALGRLLDRPAGRINRPVLALVSNKHSHTLHFGRALNNRFCPCACLCGVPMQEVAPRSVLQLVELHGKADVDHGAVHGNYSGFIMCLLRFHGNHTGFVCCCLGFGKALIFTVAVR